MRYVKPIIRGKEGGLKFGAKCNNIMVDELSFIEKQTFNAIHEGTRLKMHRRLFEVDAKKVSGDAGYAGNANREYCKEKEIQTSFVKQDCPFFVKKRMTLYAVSWLGEGRRSTVV